MPDEGLHWDWKYFVFIEVYQIKIQSLVKLVKFHSKQWTLNLHLWHTICRSNYRIRWWWQNDWYIFYKNDNIAIWNKILSFGGLIKVLKLKVYLKMSLSDNFWNLYNLWIGWWNTNIWQGQLHPPFSCVFTDTIYAKNLLRLIYISRIWGVQI